MPLLWVIISVGVILLCLVYFIYNTLKIKFQSYLKELFNINSNIGGNIKEIHYIC